MGQIRPHFCLFTSFSQYNDNIVQNLTIKRVDGLLGTRTRGSRMVGADESTELWRHPNVNFLIEGLATSDCHCGEITKLNSLLDALSSSSD